MSYSYESENSKRRQEAIERYELDPKFCPFCGTKLTFEKRFSKFCDRSCSAKFNNRGVARVPKKITYCECGKLKLRTNKYCPECAEKRIYQRPQSVESARTDEARKKMLIDIRGYRCEVCSLSEWMNKPIPIELHHIDGNSDNNSQANLQLLCRNCHGQVENHKRRNKNGKRQIMRRKRYAEGKTW